MRDEGWIDKQGHTTLALATGIFTVWKDGGKCAALGLTRWAQAGPHAGRRAVGCQRTRESLRDQRSPTEAGADESDHRRQLTFLVNAATIKQKLDEYLTAGRDEEPRNPGKASRSNDSLGLERCLGEVEQ